MFFRGIFCPEGGGSFCRFRGRGGGCGGAAKAAAPGPSGPEVRSRAGIRLRSAGVRVEALDLDPLATGARHHQSHDLVALLDDLDTRNGRRLGGRGESGDFQRVRGRSGRAKGGFAKMGATVKVVFHGVREGGLRWLAWGGWPPARPGSVSPSELARRQP